MQKLPILLCSLLLSVYAMDENNFSFDWGSNEESADDNAFSALNNSLNDPWAEKSQNSESNERDNEEDFDNFDNDDDFSDFTNDGLGKSEDQEENSFHNNTSPYKRKKRNSSKLEKKPLVKHSSEKYQTKDFLYKPPTSSKITKPTKHRQAKDIYKKYTPPPRRATPAHQTQRERQEKKRSDEMERFYNSILRQPRAETHSFAKPHPQRKTASGF